MTSNTVHLRPITDQNRTECIALSVAESQIAFVATNSRSLDQAASNPTLYPLAIYDSSARGYELPKVPMIGFAMYELVAGVGFIERIMIDQEFQGKGYGKAALVEIIRRLRLHPEVEMIAASYKESNVIAHSLFHGLSFVHWNIDFEHPPDEVFVKLSEAS